MRGTKSKLLKCFALASLAAAALAASPGARATTLNFALTGSYTANWQLDSDPTPAGSSAVDDYTYFSNVTGLSPSLLLVFYGGSVGTGGIRFSTTPDPTTEVGATVDLAGDVIFTGLVSAPHFAPGVYDVSFDYLSSPNGPTPLTTRITITTANVATTPIPAALPLFMTALAGMGVVGWRRRNGAGQI
jgi:hypothetical protein